MFSIEPSSAPVGEQLSSNEINLSPRALESASSDSALHTPRSGTQTKKFDRVEPSAHQYAQSEQALSISEKQSSGREDVQPPSVERKPYNHDILVIDTQPPRVNQRTKGREGVNNQCLFHSSSLSRNSSIRLLCEQATRLHHPIQHRQQRPVNVDGSQHQKQLHSWVRRI